MNTRQHTPPLPTSQAEQGTRTDDMHAGLLTPLLSTCECCLCVCLSVYRRWRGWSALPPSPPLSPPSLPPPPCLTACAGSSGQTGGGRRVLVNMRVWVDDRLSVFSARAVWMNGCASACLALCLSVCVFFLRGLGVRCGAVFVDRSSGLCNSERLIYRVPVIVIYVCVCGVGVCRSSFTMGGAR